MLIQVQSIPTHSETKISVSQHVLGTLNRNKVEHSSVNIDRVGLVLGF